MFYFLRRPVGGLHLTDVRFAQEEHTKSRLTDTAADGVRQFTVEKRFVESQLGSLGASALVQLTKQCFLINTNPHGRKLEGDIQNGIVNDNVTVERPIVVVGSSAVVPLA